MRFLDSAEPRDVPSFAANYVDGGFRWPGVEISRIRWLALTPAKGWPSSMPDLRDVYF